MRPRHIHAQLKESLHTLKKNISQKPRTQEWKKKVKILQYKEQEKKKKK